MHDDVKSVAPIGFEGWARELAVDEDNAFLNAIGRNHATGGCKLIITSDTSVWSLGIGVRVKRGKETPRESAW